MDGLRLQCIYILIYSLMNLPRQIITVRTRQHLSLWYPSHGVRSETGYSLSFSVSLMCH